MLPPKLTSRWREAVLHADRRAGPFAFAQGNKPRPYRGNCEGVTPDDACAGGRLFGWLQNSDIAAESVALTGTKRGVTYRETCPLVVSLLPHSGKPSRE
jgi:hypothetical protein